MSDIPLLSLDELLRRADAVTAEYDRRKLFAAADAAMAEYDRRAEIYRTRDMAGLAGMVLDGLADIEDVERLLFGDLEDAIEDARYADIHGTPQEVAEALTTIRVGEAALEARQREWSAALLVADREEAAHEAGIEWTPPRQPHTAATSSLPAFYDRPSESRAEAKARQDAGMLAHIANAQRIAAARRELRRRRADAIAAAGGDDALSPGKVATITKRIHRAVAEAHGFPTRIIPLPPQLYVTGAQGSGKTTVARQNIDRDGITQFTEPTFDKALEEFAEYQKERAKDPSLPCAMMIRGRRRSDPKRPGHYMCPRHVAAERVAQAGLSVVKAMCTTCPLQNECGDRRQEREAREMEAAGRGGAFMASEYLFTSSPGPKPDHIVADESLLVMAAQPVEVPVSVLHPYGIAGIGVSSWNTVATILQALQNPATGLQTLHNAGINRKEMRSVVGEFAAELERQTPDLSGRMSDAEIIDALDNASTRGAIAQALIVLRAVAKEIDRRRRTINAVWLRAETETVMVSRLRKIYGLRDASLTALDGTGDIVLARKLFGNRLQHLHVPFPRPGLHVIGTVGKGYGRKSFTGTDRHGKPQDWRVGDAGRLRGDIAKIYAQQLPPGAAIFASKKVWDALHRSGTVPADTPGTNFEALRGKNEWERTLGALIIGCESISLRDLEARARAYLADDDEPFVSMDVAPDEGWGYRRWPCKCTRMRRNADGTKTAVEVEVHPDPRVQRFYEQIREAEVIQAADRLRPIWNHRQIVLLNNLVLDFDYVANYTHAHLVAGGSRIERAFLTNGIVPLSADLLHRLHPSLFRSRKAAEQAVRNYPLTPSTPSIWEVGVVRFRLAGRHGPEARAWIDMGRHLDPKAALEAAFGPLQSYQGVASGEPAEARGKWRASRRKPLPWGGLGRVTLPPSPWNDPDWRPGRVLDG